MLIKNLVVGLLGANCYIILDENTREAVGDDLKFFGSLGSPSLIISDVDISG